MKPRISVIMSTYNHEKFVSQAVASVLKQSYKNFEFLIYDDGSNDKTPDVLLRYTDGRIRLIQAVSNKGACVGLNHLIDQCKGEYICVINSDDVFMSSKLEKQIEYMDKHQEYAASFTWVELIDEKGMSFEDGRHFYYELFDKCNMERTEWLKYFFYNGNCLCHPTIMIRRRDVLRFDERLYKLPDFEMWVRLLKRHQIGIMPERLTKFRICDNEKNMSGNKPETHSVIAFEMPLVLDNYLSLSREDCAAVFGCTGNNIDRKFTAYKSALKGSKAMQAWGISGIYALMEETSQRDILEKKGFSLNKLFNLAKKTDLYSQCKHSAQLFYASESDIVKSKKDHPSFSGERCISSPACDYRVFSHLFEINKKVKALRFDPCEHPCIIENLKIELVSENGEAIICNAFKHNGKNEGDKIEFAHVDPSFVVELAKAIDVKQVNISGEWDLIELSSLLPAPCGII